MRSKSEICAYFESILPDIRAIGRERGYAVAVHGSMQRDLDLVAVPWTDKATEPEDLVLAIGLKYAQRAGSDLLIRPIKVRNRYLYHLLTEIYQTDHKGYNAGYIELSITPKARAPRSAYTAFQGVLKGESQT